MKRQFIVTSTVLASALLASPATAENLEHLRQLLSTKQCQQCNLRGAGFVMADLSGAQLQGADFTGANLSRTNLSGANLSGARLAGASLHGANLIGANLAGADIAGADLRNAYLVNANLAGVNLNNAHIQGVKGIPASAGSAVDFYRWALLEGQKGNYVGAVEHYNQALNLDPNLSAAYLGRGLARYRLGDEAGATQDAQIAEAAFLAEGNTQGVEASQNFIKGMEVARQPAKPQGGGSNFLNVLGAIGGLLLRLIF